MINFDKIDYVRKIDNTDTNFTFCYYVLIQFNSTSLYHLSFEELLYRYNY